MEPAVSYFDELREGSKHHAVDLRSEWTFTIKPADRTDECFKEFQKIVELAVAHAIEEDYRILTHPEHGPAPFEFATITRL